MNPPPSEAFDRYGSDVLSPAARAARERNVPEVPAELELVVEEVTTGWCGAVVRVEKSGGMHVVVLEDGRGKTRTFPIGPGFWIDGEPVILVPPRPAAPAPVAPEAAHWSGARTASGGLAGPTARARVAAASRIWVEGKHDAELIEKVWGDDLRSVGVVVELLDGVDNLPDAAAEFAPTRSRRIGVLVDHLVRGSKETRIANAVMHSHPESVIVLGHPYVDVWQAIRPERLGLKKWPTIHHGTEWKLGILAELGWPHANQGDVAQAWKRMLGTVRDYRDLEVSLVARVEELIDFVTAP